MRSEKELLDRLEWLRNQESYYKAIGDYVTAELYRHGRYEIRYALNIKNWDQLPETNKVVKQKREWDRYILKKKEISGPKISKIKKYFRIFKNNTTGELFYKWKL